MMVWPRWGATNTSGRELTWGPCALKQKYHLPVLTTLFKTAAYLVSTNFYQVLLSVTSSGTKFYQTPCVLVNTDRKSVGL